MSPLSPVEWTWLVIVLLGLATLLYLTPSCGDATCTATHARHTGTERAEQTHKAFHDVNRPAPTCALCQARKRDDDAKRDEP